MSRFADRGYREGAVTDYYCYEDVYYTLRVVADYNTSRDAALEREHVQVFRYISRRVVVVDYQLVYDREKPLDGA